MPVGTLPDPLEARTRAGFRAHRGHRLLGGLLTRTRAHRSGFRRSAEISETDRWARPGRRRACPGVLRGGARLRPALRPAPAQRRVGSGFGRGGRAREARRDDLPRCQHRVGKPVRAVRRGQRHRRARRDRRGKLPALQSHPPPGHRRRRPLHPGLPAAVPLERPGRDRGAGRAGGQRRDAGVRRRRAGADLRRPLRRAGGGARRRLPGRGEGDRVLRGVRHGPRPCAAGAPGPSCTTRCTTTTS